MDKSPIKKLSAELRNRIFELALAHPFPIVINGCFNSTGKNLSKTATP